MKFYLSFLITTFLFSVVHKTQAQDTIHNYVSMHIHFAMQGHHLPNGTFQYKLRLPDGSPTTLSQNLNHKGYLLYGFVVQPQWNQRRIGKKLLPKNLELSTAIHMAFMRAPGGNFRSGRMNQVEFGLKETVRYHVHPRVYVSFGILVPFGMNALLAGDMDITPVSFGGEVVSGPVNVRLNTTFVGTHPQFQIGYDVVNKKRNRLSLEAGVGYHFWHNIRNRMLMTRGINNVVIEDTQFWIKDYTFNGEYQRRKDFNRSSAQAHAGIRFYFY